MFVLAIVFPRKARETNTRKSRKGHYNKSLRFSRNLLRPLRGIEYGINLQYIIMVLHILINFNKTIPQPIPVHSTIRYWFT